MLDCLNPNLGQIWTNSNVGLKIQFKKCAVDSKVEVGFKFEITFVTQIWVKTTQHCLEYELLKYHEDDLVSDLSSKILCFIIIY